MTDDKPEAPSPTDPNLEQWGEAPEKMRKGITLHVMLYIEGDDQPAHNFSKSTIETVREIISAGSAGHPELTVTIKKIAEK